MLRKVKQGSGAELKRIQDFRRIGSSLVVIVKLNTRSIELDIPQSIPIICAVTTGTMK